MAQEFKGRDVLKLRKTPFVREYDNNTKMKGQMYNIFVLGDKVFTVTTTDPFVKSFDEGEVFSIELEEGAEGWSFQSYTTHAAERKMAQTENALKYYENFYVPEGAVAKEDLIGD